ncbi:LacI family DNA-binding transcriptional regulator [Pluralibacter sp.]|uniref:LacI family DNA-binding transcriptional regulator n=1 Tax=Pluralibacter sp. TaxID=1920032 RepID=UPI0025DEAD74|nr:LacI family DNA-binding transcriptional regulator [Pluralibacter sp.]MBV8043983.1 LacI family DNA-binding transcriptional regulator [Pluralibacter sp.]
MSNVTVADIARHLGISTATVSMTLRNKGRISEQTRQRVLKAIDELGYVYNQTAANLRNRSSNQVGLLLHDITNPFYAEMTAGLSREMENHDLMLFLANSEESADRQQQFMDSLQRNNAAGMVICAAQPTPHRFFESLQRRCMPTILVVRPVPDVAIDFVGTDNFLGCQMATEHLLRLGHRHIAFIGGQTVSISRSRRLGGYMSKLIEHGIAPNQEWIISCGANRNDGTQAMMTILEKHPEVTAAVCYQDVVALGAMLALRKQGKVVGCDFALVGFDDIPESALAESGVTTVSVAAREIGRKAGELLLERIAGNDEPAKSVILVPTLVIRQSCGS